MTDWIATLAESKNLKNYCVNFYKTDSIMVTAQDAAKIKFAILNDIRCFEIKDSVYMTSSVSSVERKKGQEMGLLTSSVDGVDEHSQEQLDAKEEFNRRMSMNFYFDKNQKLLNNTNNEQ